MDEGHYFVLAILIIVSLFMVLPAVILGNISKWKQSRGLKPDDERMLEDLWRSARTMERRIDVLESILDEEAPDWRRKNTRGR